MRPLKEVLEENKQTYIQRLMDLIAIDTHDLGHGIAGGAGKAGAGVYGEIVRGYGRGYHPPGSHDRGSH